MRHRFALIFRCFTRKIPLILTAVLKRGENKLDIEVTNCWANRLIGDAALPADQRYTRTNVRLVPERGDFEDYMAWAATDPLLPSGLAGPVVIEFGEEKEILFQ